MTYRHELLSPFLVESQTTDSLYHYPNCSHRGMDKHPRIIPLKLAKWLGKRLCENCR